MGMKKLHLLGIVLAVAILGVAFSAAPASAATTTDITVDPANQSIASGDSATYDIVVEDVDNGVGSYTFNASVGDTSVATITDYELEGTSSDEFLTSAELSSDNSTLEVSAGAADHSDGTIATVTVTADSTAAGSETDLSTSVSALGDSDSASYSIGETTPATVFVPTSSDEGSNETNESFDGVVVSPSPTSNEVPVGSTTEIDITASNLTDGISSASFNLSVGSVDAAKITAINPTDVSTDNAIVSTTIADDGSYGSLDAGSIGSDDGVIATVTIDGVSEQNTTLSVNEATVGDVTFGSYAVTTTEGELVVTEDADLAAPPVVVGENKPGNLAGDKGVGEDVYEDINGDGTFNIVDAGAFFTNFDSDAVQNNTAAFDYNGDDKVNIIDAGLLFSEL